MGREVREMPSSSPPTDGQLRTPDVWAAVFMERTSSRRSTTGGWRSCGTSSAIGRPILGVRNLLKREGVGYLYFGPDERQLAGTTRRGRRSSGAFTTGAG